MGNKKLQLDSKNKMIGGVGSGIAKYFEIDATVVRLGLVLALILLRYWGVIFYLVAYLLMKENTKSELVYPDEEIELEDIVVTEDEPLEPVKEEELIIDEEFIEEEDGNIEEPEEETGYIEVEETWVEEEEDTKE